MVPTKARGVESNASQGRPGAWVQLNRAVRVAIYMTVEAGHAVDWLRGEAMFTVVKPARGKLRDQKPQPFNLLG